MNLECLSRSLRAKLAVAGSQPAETDGEAVAQGRLPLCYGAEDQAQRQRCESPVRYTILFFSWNCMQRAQKD